MSLRAHSELVFRGWVLGVPGIPAGKVALELPRDTSGWADTGFVTVTAGVGGSAPGLDTPIRGPVFQIDCWAVSPSSSKAPWGRANQLAELIVADCYASNANPDLRAGRRRVVLGGDFRDAVVHTAAVVGEPRRMREDDASFARYSMDLQLWWTEIPG
jgi:hypothetical protein